MVDSYLITGGAGFVGINLARYYLSKGTRVVIFDNLSRAGSEKNLRWLQQRDGNGLTVMHGDVRQSNTELFEAVDKADVVLHLAAQVAVTTSVANPREDFEVNALGTLNVLEAARLSSSQPIVFYSSTNKVYGRMEDIAVVESAGRYTYAQLPYGIPESRSLDFHSPYGCSKGIGDQYVIDYARIYGLKTVVFRQSCIYGPRQFGVEDQGWIAWFAIRAVQNLPVIIYGDGKQVRDVLYIDDLIAAIDAAIEHIDETTGHAYNIGGGPENTLSLLELIQMLEHRLGRKLKYTFANWRPGDQRVFISGIQKAKRDFGWEPQVSPTEGVAKLLNWLEQNDGLFARL